MSKQCTLFRAWGGKSSSKPSSSSTNTGGTRVSSNGTSGKGEAYTFDDFDQFDEFFQDDVADEMVKVCDQPNVAGPSRPPSLNASIIEDIPGFDEDAGQLWVYPTNYPIRDYQFNIVQKALFRNVLVCLPTGLGKTFIAAVVMYNFYRWYPSGKIIFLAPTKPLVTQQIEACYNVMGIPQSDAAEMTGNLPPRDRNQQWRSRRVFFLTPQVMQNDLARGACPAEDVCCVVFDEAHKALGNHAYCQVVKELSNAGSRFRVLALSATPGNDLKAVQQVVTNLQVSQIELRSEDSFDIQRYVHERQVEKFVVPFQGEILEVKTAFLKVLSGVVGRLARLGLLYHSNADRISKYQILQARDQYRMNPPQGAAGVHVGVIEGDFALAISLYHAYELLQQHGMRSFHQFLTQAFSAGGGQSRAKMEVMRSPEFGRIMRSLQEKLGQGSVPDSPGRRTPRRSPGGERSSGSFFYSHPKLVKLEEVVVGHFRKLCEQSTSSVRSPGGSVNTRVMIFSQYRESVQEIADMLSQHAPLVRVMSFVGHSGKSSSKGLTQKEQTEVVRNFRQGGYNTLVATCVGEEGLDIGEVDLIVCFDAHKSPIRLVQRMGRTGRKRSGRIVVIVAEGKEEQIYLKSQSNKTSIHRAIRDGCKSLQFYQAVPRMVPRHIHPEVHKMHMSIDAYVDPKAGKSGRAVRERGGQSRLSFGPTKKDPKGVYLTDSELEYWSKNFALSDRDSKAIERAVDRCVSQPPSLMSIAQLNAKRGKETTHSSLHNVSFGVNTSMNSSVSQSGRSLSLSRWVHWQTAPVSHKIVSDSLRSKQLMSSLEFIDLCQTSEGMGHSYELEMETFLNLEDVKTDLRGRRRSPSEEQEKDDGCMHKRNITRKRQRVFEDSSEDEDFRPSSSKRTSVGKTAVVSVDEEGSSNSGGEGRDRCVSEREDVIMVDGEEGDGGDDVGEEGLPPEGDLLEVPDSPSGRDEGSNLQPNDRGLLTNSQHVVPKAPSIDSLDWLDEIEPSQISTPRVTPASKREREKGGSEFCFATPKLPPSLRKTRPPLPNPTPSVKPLPNPTPSATHATPPVTHATPPVTPIRAINSPPKNTESIDLFSDLSSAALFDDFSLSFQRGPNTNPPRSPAHTEEQPNMQQLSNITPDFNPRLERGPHKSTSLHLKNQDIAPSATMEDNCVELDEEMITAIAESDLDDEPVSPKTETRGSHSASSEPVSTSYLEDSFLLTHGRGHKKSRKGVEFLRSPTGASCSSVSPYSKENKVTFINLSDEALDTLTVSGKENQPRQKYPKRVVGKVVCVDSESSDDEFQAPLLKRVKKQTVTFSAKTQDKSPDWEQKEMRGGQVHGFVEDKAELSSDGHCEASADEEMEEDSNCYDFEDSFINDASMLTQVSPTQRPAGATRGAHPPASMGDVYRRSLMSPDTLFAGQRRRMGNQYRMVFSQRHRLLNHYINKAGFDVSPRARRSRAKKPHFLSDSVCEVAEREGCLAETAGSSCSEAEEVHVCYGEEEEKELPGSQSTEDVGCQSELARDRVFLQKRNPGFLSDSDMEGSEPQGDGPVCGSSAGKRMKFSWSPGSPLNHTAVNEREKETVPRSMPANDDVIISPSLLANITVHSTPSCFSLGMEEWIDSGSSSNGREEGEEGESPIQPNTSHLTTDDDDLGGILTQQELEENFDLGVDCFSDLDTPDEEGDGSCDNTTRGEEQIPSDVQPCERQTCPDLQPCERWTCQKTAICLTKAGNQTSRPLGIAGSDTPPFVQPNPSSNRTTNMIVPDPSLHVTGETSVPSHVGVPSPRVAGEMSGSSPPGVILVSSREVTYSQIASTLRYKHNLLVTLCSLSHGGYIVSNRMVVERKLYSEFVTASAGSKVLAKLSELKGLFDSVCLIIEDDPVREGRKKTTAKPGQYFECALARLIASRVTVLFSQSQANTASLLAELVERERRKGHGISVSLQEEAQHVLPMLLAIPHVSYITALNLCTSFPTLHMLLQSSPEELRRRVSSLSLTRAQEICSFFGRTFNPHLIG